MTGKRHIITNSKHSKQTRDLFETLRHDTKYSDVTIHCENGQTVNGHRCVLGQASEYIEKLFGHACDKNICVIAIPTMKFNIFN